MRIKQQQAIPPDSNAQVATKRRIGAGYHRLVEFGIHCSPRVKMITKFCGVFIIRSRALHHQYETDATSLTVVV